MKVVTVHANERGFVFTRVVQVIAHDSLAEAIELLRASEKFRAWQPPYATKPSKWKDEAGRTIEASNIMAAEKHYTPQELAEIWGVSVQTIRDIFQNEEGVLKIGRDGTRTRRRYKTLRIPESVAERVHTRLSASPC